ncbi:acyltransferase family protein [Escherichia coli]|uniref:acyltransferase family protein n=1 Tax=Escherichia coli TaxID=562 RepID=UPI001C5F3693|nr:acyltransferase family protein [Escherichia coli]MBY8666854.1 hypothetical protein [Escherichia coli]MBY8675481.1 hypothetical protein [Escherichia coli]MBY8752697.1 hypothetical protein [Escherichia coli]MCL7080139.1 hypothetical protein [Escherichia coli]MCL7216457.1 hypothetical protein [Escherichia coli]
MNYGVVFARFIAIILVVLLHASAGPVGAKLAPDWEWANVYSAISKQCIGIFIVITGFLYAKEGANKRGNSSRLTQSFHFFMFEPIFSPVNALNQPI